jgi:hypothetical protein
VQIEGAILKNENEIPNPNEVPVTPDEIPENPDEYPVNPEPIEPNDPGLPEPEPIDNPEP